MKCDVSVIVPVYNVEKYIEKCVKSILNQTFKKYEIILVDDGSTDNSGEICDKLSEASGNIRVFHKNNGGLSDARNYGAKKSEGKYIAFIDSDDYIRCDYLEVLYDNIKKNNSDISVVLPKVVYEDTDFSIANNNNDINKIEVMTGKDILPYSLLNKKGSLSAWGKLFKKELILDHPFPYGELYEDMEVIYNIYLKSESICFINAKLYFYLHRDKSIVNSRITEKHLYGIKSCIHMLEISKKEKYNMDKYIKCRIVMQACGHLPNLIKYRDKDMFTRISKMIRGYVKDIMFIREAPLKLKIRGSAYILNAKIGLLYAKCFLDAKQIINDYSTRKASS